MLLILSHVCGNVEDSKALFESVKQQLLGFSLSPAMIATGIKIVSTVSLRN